MIASEPLIEDWWEGNAPQDLEPDEFPPRVMLEWAGKLWLRELARGLALTPLGCKPILRAR